MTNIDSEWKNFLKTLDTNISSGYCISSDDNDDNSNTPDFSDDVDNEPNSNIVEDFRRMPCEELYISTQTRIFFLNVHHLDVNKIFWNIQVIPYFQTIDGVIKKQIRLVCKTKEEYEMYVENRNKEEYFKEKIIKQIDNPNARKIKFKDVRKLTVGLSKKDIMNCHGKNKNAFINCFAIILRVKHENKYQEIHVKVFNTGRLAIPGIVNEELLEKTKLLLLNILQNNFEEKLY